MKKRLETIVATLAIVAAVCCIFVSCGGEKNQSDTARRQRVDIPLDENDTVPTPDQMVAELRGPVLQMTQTSTYGKWVGDSVDTEQNLPYMTYEWTFNPNGSIKSISAQNRDDKDITLSTAMVTERNRDGYPVNIEISYTDTDSQPLYQKDEKIEWVDGRPAKRDFSDQYTTEKHENEYDANGLLKKHEMIMHDGREGYKQTDIYKYISFDDHGNWTERYVRSLGVTIYCDENGNPTGYGDSQRFFSVERRDLTYRH